MEIRQLSEKDIRKYRKRVYELLEMCLCLTYTNVRSEVIDSKIDGLIQYINDEKAYTFGAIEENDMIGFLWGYPVSTPFDTVFHVAYIAVSEKGRRQGIGNKLMIEAEKKTMELRIDHVELIVGASNEGSISFYSREGYEPDRLIMRKRVT
ncbi:Ribosomal protein S18 acetylase RimI [Lachnospiraceae bacterium RM5]|nr:Ribosomal protein S18 acetylase RimI [Lachnospiraceae bacterium RM5]